MQSDDLVPKGGQKDINNLDRLSPMTMWSRQSETDLSIVLGSGIDNGCRVCQWVGMNAFNRNDFNCLDFESKLIRCLLIDWKWRRRRLENRDGGAWKMGSVELGKWKRWSLENGDSRAWMWGSLDALIWSCLCKDIEDLFNRNVVNWLDKLSFLSQSSLIAERRKVTGNRNGKASQKRTKS